MTSKTAAETHKAICVAVSCTMPESYHCSNKLNRVDVCSGRVCFAGGRLGIEVQFQTVETLMARYLV